MRLKLIVTALATCGMAATAAVSNAAPVSQSVTAPRAATAGTGYAPASSIAAGGPIHGMIISDANKPFGANMGDLQRLADDGVNLVTLYVTNYFTSTRNPDIVTGPLTPSDQQVAAVISAAHSAGLAVELEPLLWAKGPYHWRGSIDPEDINSFWAKYSAMMLRYAKVAQSNGAELFVLGSEYSHLQKYTSRWRQLAASVRQVYRGRLTYMAVTQSVAKVRFWPSLDYIGNSPYYQLSTQAIPSYSELRAAWRRPFQMLRATSVKYHRPILFNEIGYLSAQGATTSPWASRPIGPASQTVQANAYAALLDAAATQPWLKGVVFYRWSSTSAPVDRTWSPRDKRAECEMARRWASPTSPRLPDGFPVGCLAAELAKSAGLP